MTIGIIGGGASGMAAALAAAENEKAQVVLMERQARVGRKLQATGNGRCNLTNLHALEGGYHGENPAFSEYALEAFGPEVARSWFRGLGLYTVAEDSGRVYPYSDQANSVVDARVSLISRTSGSGMLAFARGICARCSFVRPAEVKFCKMYGAISAVTKKSQLPLSTRMSPTVSRPMPAPISAPRKSRWLGLSP